MEPGKNHIRINIIYMHNWNHLKNASFKYWNYLQELARVEEEIATLRSVLTSKVRHAGELKRKLGITVWKEISDDMNQGLKNVRDSQVFQKTESAIKSTAEKTTSILGGLTMGISSKLSQMKKSDSYRSIEERVGSAYENVRVNIFTAKKKHNRTIQLILFDIHFVVRVLFFLLAI